MGELFKGLVEIQDASGTDTKVRLDGDNADITAGGNGQDGDITLKAGDGQDRIRLDAGNGDIWVGGNGAGGDIVIFRKDDDNKNGSQATIHLNGNGGIEAGGRGVSGNITLKAANGRNIIRLGYLYGIGLVAGATGASFGGKMLSGSLLLFNAAGDGETASQSTIHLSGHNADISAGGHGQDGDITLKSGDGKTRMHLDGHNGNILAGGNGAGGDIALFPRDGDNKTASQATILLNGGAGVVVLKSAANGQNRIRLDARGGDIALGGNGVDGDLVLFPRKGDNKTLSQSTIHLNGDAGDIILRNADCAEEFDILEDEIEPGTVMVIDHENGLRQSEKPYDKKVAGVLSGAGDYRPGIVLGREESKNSRKPLALSGKVYCKVDASYAPVEVGDLLTTSSTPGHAMKAEDPLSAFGAVIGKALRPLKEGKGMIPVLVALQ